MRGLSDLPNIVENCHFIVSRIWSQVVRNIFFQSCMAEGPFPVSIASLGMITIHDDIKECP